jgi:hypothetical protein
LERSQRVAPWSFIAGFMPTPDAVDIQQVFKRVNLGRPDFRRFEDEETSEIQAIV